MKTVQELKSTAASYLAGGAVPFAEADSLWRDLKRNAELALARRVLERVRQKKGLLDPLPATVRNELCTQEALLTSKDQELPAATRHDRALDILRDGIGELTDPALDEDHETLGIVGGILKRRWNDLGQLGDLQQSALFYERGAKGKVRADAYTHINAAFMNDLLAHAGDHTAERLAKAQKLRETIIDELPPTEAVSPGNQWFNTASRAEAFFGLRRYAEAIRVLAESSAKPAPWEVETTARQIATLAHLQEERPFDLPEIRTFFELLLPGAPDAARSVMIGRVGLALSGGGFRASFYHLGVLARLAELNVLRHVDALSCVSGGSIVGAHYWLALRRRMLEKRPLTREDYVALVQSVIASFTSAVATDIRGAVQPSKSKIAWRLLWNGEKGALDPELTAQALEDRFYAPLFDNQTANCMHDLPFTPADHNESTAQSREFHPGRHNWLRANKVPVLVLNATTVNTGHAWQFSPTWMGESPWAIHEAADAIPRLQWSWYEKDAGWKMEVARAVAASACVPGVFAPLEIRNAYEGYVVQLVDGGVHDNQGTVSLLALDCNVLLVSDACGQLQLEKAPSPGLGGLLSYANRSMSTLMERVRLANYADLAARKQTGLLRGLMFLHMKAGLDAEAIRLPFSAESYVLERELLSPSGVRKDFQQALADLRTDLDAFTPDESNALMACGYQMTKWAFQRDLSRLKGLADEAVTATWPFQAMWSEITSTAASTPRRKELLEAFKQGAKIRT